jgi:hypothetical protein
VVGGAGDLGVDVEGRDPAGRKVVVQCKRYAPWTKVGSPEVQTFIGMASVHHRAESATFVTTSAFSAPAMALGARHEGYLRLVDGQELDRMLVEAGLTAPPLVRTRTQGQRVVSPRAVGTLAVGAVVAILAILAIVGYGSQGRTTTGSGGVACLDISTEPAMYIAPSNDTSCPIGYEPKQACIDTTNQDPLAGTGGCPWVSKPHTWP